MDRTKERQPRFTGVLAMGKGLTKEWALAVEL